MMIKQFQTFLHYTIWSCVLIIPLELRHTASVLAFVEFSSRKGKMAHFKAE